jgi:hypothetical protein
VPKITRCQQQQSGDGDGEIDGGAIENVKAIVELAERVDANGRKHIRIAKVSRPGECLHRLYRCHKQSSHMAYIFAGVRLTFPTLPTLPTLSTPEEDVVDGDGDGDGDGDNDDDGASWAPKDGITWKYELPPKVPPDAPAVSCISGLNMPEASGEWAPSVVIDPDPYIY